jgi:hypothetical protein
MANSGMLDNHRRRWGDPRGNVISLIIHVVDDMDFARQFDQIN